MARRPLLLALTVLCLFGAARQATAEVAPGLVTVPIRPVGVRDGPDPSGLSVGAALPDGRVVLAGLDPGKGLVLAQLRPDGSLDPAFGEDGVAHVSVPVGPPFGNADPMQLLRAADGRLVIAMQGEMHPFELRQFLVARLTPDGRLDASFGEGGVARPGVQAGCGNGCEPMALSPDGSIALAGATGSVATAQSRFQWVIARLTPGGALDPSFGSGGLAMVPGEHEVGYGAAVVPGGAVASVGQVTGGGAKLTRVTATGQPDPAFHGGAPIDLPAAEFWFHVLAHGDGRLDVLGSGNGAATQLRRYAPTGEPDGGFGDHGAVLLPASATGIDALAPGPGGGAIVTGPTTLNPGTQLPGLRVSRVAPGGAITGTGVVPIPFGGGYATPFATGSAPLRQGSFRAGTPVARSDGTLVVPGSVAVIETQGEGGIVSDQGAAAALTSGFALDRSFGGPRRDARVRLRVPRQRARSASRRKSVLVTATTSGPGLCLLRVKAGRKVIARTLAPAFTRGRQRLRAVLTIRGRRRLRHARRLRVTVAVTFRDFVGARARASTRAVLR